MSRKNWAERHSDLVQNLIGILLSHQEGVNVGEVLVGLGVMFCIGVGLPPLTLSTVKLLVINNSLAEATLFTRISNVALPAGKL